MIVDSRADDIVYSNLFTGVHGNYLRPSIVAAGGGQSGDREGRNGRSSGKFSHGLLL